MIHISFQNELTNCFQYCNWQFFL